VLSQPSSVGRLAAEAEMPVGAHRVSGVGDSAELTVRAELRIGERLDPARRGRRPVGDDENRGLGGRGEALGERQSRVGGRGARADPELDLG
jgi:hypothetical protein